MNRARPLGSTEREASIGVGFREKRPQVEEGPGSEQVPHPDLGSGYGGAVFTSHSPSDLATGCQSDVEGQISAIGAGQGQDSAGIVRGQGEHMEAVRNHPLEGIAARLVGHGATSVREDDLGP